jgi:hypothetical protein
MSTANKAGRQISISIYPYNAFNPEKMRVQVAFLTAIPETIIRLHAFTCNAKSDARELLGFFPYAVSKSLNKASDNSSRVDVDETPDNDRSLTDYLTARDLNRATLSAPAFDASTRVIVSLERLAVVICYSHLL